MKHAGLALGLMTVALAAGPAMAQRPTQPSPAFIAERDAAAAALVGAEKLLNDSDKRGPKAEACKLMASHFLHTVRAAAAAGAKTRIADWPELGWDEQVAVMEKVPGPYDRNTKLRSHACTGPS